jgi:hypothetical protein
MGLHLKHHWPFSAPIFQQGRPRVESAKLVLDPTILGLSGPLSNFVRVGGVGERFLPRAIFRSHFSKVFFSACIRCGIMG